MVITTLTAKHCHKPLCGKRKKKASGSTLISYRSPSQDICLDCAYFRISFNCTGTHQEASRSLVFPTRSWAEPQHGSPGLCCPAQRYILVLALKPTSFAWAGPTTQHHGDIPQQATLGAPPTAS